MFSGLPVPRRFTWLLLLGALIALPSRGFAQSLYADLDHDGVRDEVSLDPAHVYVLRVWLSSTQTFRVLHVTRPVVKMGAFDMDGDGRLELVTSDTAAALHIWQNKGWGKLRPYTPRRSPPRAGRGTKNILDKDTDATDDAVASASGASPPLDAPSSASFLRADGRSIAFPIAPRHVVQDLADSTSSRGPPMITAG